MFAPKFTITNQLLANIKQITALIQQLNCRHFAQPVLFKFEKTALAVSTFASTSIEGNPLPLTAVKQILKEKPVNIHASEREVLNYNQALINLQQKTATRQQNLSLKLILKIHQQVTKELLPNHESGKLRQNPVVVNDPRIGQIVYLPPDWKEVITLMTELIDFINSNRTKIDPLILAGIFHKQFVIIHPFMDGNGRTTRLATKILLSQMGLDTFNLFSFENYYNSNVSNYFKYVGEYGDYQDLVGKIDFTDWLEYFTQGIFSELNRVSALLPESGSTPETRLESYHQQILQFIETHGFINDKDYSQLTKRAKATRVLDFQKLVDLDLIKRQGKGRATYYVFS